MKEVDNDRRHAVDTAVSTIEKAFGRGSIMRLGDDHWEEPMEVITPGGVLASNLWRTRNAAYRAMVATASRSFPLVEVFECPEVGNAILIAGKQTSQPDLARLKAKAATLTGHSRPRSAEAECGPLSIAAMQTSADGSSAGNRRRGTGRLARRTPTGAEQAMRTGGYQPVAPLTSASDDTGSAPPISLPSSK